MLDKRFIREHPDAVKAAVRAKGIDLDVDEILHLDAASRKLQHELDQAQARRKTSSREFAQADEARRAALRAEHAELETHLRALREQLAETTEKLQALMLLTPMIPWAGAPVGPDESANVTIRTHRHARRSSISSPWTMWSCWKSAAGPTSRGLARCPGNGPTR